MAIINNLITVYNSKRIPVVWRIRIRVIHVDVTCSKVIIVGVDPVSNFRSWFSTKKTY